MPIYNQYLPISQKMDLEEQSNPSEGVEQGGVCLRSALFSAEHKGDAGALLGQYVLGSVYKR